VEGWEFGEFGPVPDPNERKMAGAMDSLAAGERPSDASFSVLSTEWPAACQQHRVRRCLWNDDADQDDPRSGRLRLRDGILWLFEVVEEGSQAAQGAAADRADAADGHGNGSADLRVSGLRWIELQLDEASFPVG
jgi:hypothetical protein